MSLKKAIEKAITGKGEFGILSPEGFHSAPPIKDFSRFKRCPVITPLQNSPSSIWTFLQILDQGVIPILLPPDTPSEKLKDLRKSFPGFGYLDKDEIIVEGQPIKADPRLFLVLLTSGSTGKPKLIGTAVERLENGIQAIAKAQGLESLSATGITLPLAYSYALVNQLLWSLFYERALVLPPGFGSPADTLGMFKTSQVEMLCMVGVQIRSLAALGFGKNESLPNVKIVNFAGAPFPVEHFDKIRELFPRARLLNNYGCTEAMPRLTVCKVQSKDHSITNVGQPIAGIQLRIQDSLETGPIEFRGPSSSIGIVLPDGQVQEHLDWIPSGDTGFLKEGTLHVLGRHDQVIKAGGERISLMEIEQTLVNHIAHNAAVWSLSLSEGSKVPIAVITGKKPPESQELRITLRNHLNHNAWPYKIFWSQTWPLTPNGKTDRKLLEHLAQSDQLPLIWESPRKML